MLVATSLCIGYWYGLIANELFNSDFAPESYNVPVETHPELIKAHQEIKNLKQELSQVSNANDHGSGLKPKTRAADFDPEKTGHLTGLNNHQTNDTVDLAEPNLWTPVSASDIQAALDQNGISNTSIYELQCHSSLCEAKFIHESNDAHYQLIQQLGSIEEFSKGFVIKSDNNENQLETTIYFHRSSQHSS